MENSTDFEKLGVTEQAIVDQLTQAVKDSVKNCEELLKGLQEIPTDNFDSVMRDPKLKETFTITVLPYMQKMSANLGSALLTPSLVKILLESQERNA